MDRLLDLIFTGGLRRPLFHPDVLALERQLPRSELVALLLLQRHGERTMSELAEVLGAPLSTASGIVVRLTRKGETAAGKLREQVDGLLRRVAGALTEEELAQLLALLAKAWAAFQSPPRQASPDTAFRSIPIDE